MKSFDHLTIICIKATQKQVLEGFVNEFSPKELQYQWRKNIIVRDSFYHYYEQKTGYNTIKCLIYSPKCKPDTTVFYTNLDDGWNHFVEHYLIKHNNWDSYYFSFADAPNILLPSFQMFNYGNGGHRYLLCQKEAKWIFYQEGNPLPFEDIERYKQRLIKKRVDTQLLLKYMRMAGWDLESDDFWIAEGDAIEYEQIKESK